MNWLGRVWSILLLGPPGVGKTMVGTILFREAVGSWAHGGTWLDAANLLYEMRSAFGSGRKTDAEIAARGPGVLLLDDLGSERGTEHARTTLSEILLHRHRECFPTIVTSNGKTAKDLESVLDARVISRLSEGEIALLSGPDRRAQ